MDRIQVFDAILSCLEEELGVLQRAAAEAREAATHEQAKPENQYDTRALEQSYLAGAQHQRALELEAGLLAVRNLRARPAAAAGASLGSLVTLSDGEQQRHYLLSPSAGGTAVSVGGQKVHVVTPAAPLGRVLLGKAEGDQVELPPKAAVFEVLELA